MYTCTDITTLGKYHSCTLEQTLDQLHWISWCLWFLILSSLFFIFSPLFILNTISWWSFSLPNLKSDPPSPVGYFRGSLGIVTVFFTKLPLKCICLVFHGESGQNEYILIIFSFTNIVWIVPSIDLYWFQFKINFPVHIFILEWIL